MKLERDITFCKEGDHTCCPCGYYYNLFLVIDETKQEVKKLFLCPLRAKKYADTHNLWLIQTMKLDDQAVKSFI
jgi:hypothetical protein